MGSDEGKKPAPCRVKLVHVAAASVVLWLVVLDSQARRLHTPPASLRGLGRAQTNGAPDGAQPPGAQAKPSTGAANGVLRSGGDAVHVVFSTDCGAYQTWQAEVLYHSAELVGQPGTITRIVSGCDDAGRQALEQRHLAADLAGRFLVHFTPHFSKDANGADYKFYNKPFGVLHWLNHAPVPEDVVALIDPDFIFLRRLVNDFSNASTVISTTHQASTQTRVTKGRPVSQFYGLGDEWLKLDRGKICGNASRCARTTSDEAWKSFSVGPPYMAHKDDLLLIAQKWVEFVPRVFSQYPFLLAEMFAYSMAAAHLGLSHLRFDSFMVSNVASYGEAWQWIDASPISTCDVSKPQDLWPSRNVPVFLHYCQGYAWGKWHYGKHRVPLDVFSNCQERVIERPTKAEIGGDLYARAAVGDKAARDERRNLFALCAGADTVNAVSKKFSALRLRSDGGEACPVALPALPLLL
ncbi:hypothetical protein M885DRAFT_618164 [Pelagophyceae sp. CCMP2097]|nr:hypothetical protein M885DRAFT_618164 [Pelagophyceae sp. CCMP2097]|mmetsp:Transcript_20150/g.71665  ORF Transcript_20150/g.71665 Transcript_20150/m.71665 type:complete len:466 (-) Transcript_20150:6-1403(-)